MWQVTAKVDTVLSISLGHNFLDEGWKLCFTSLCCPLDKTLEPQQLLNKCLINFIKLLFLYTLPKT